MGSTSQNILTSVNHTCSSYLSAGVGGAYIVCLRCDQLLICYTQAMACHRLRSTSWVDLLPLLRERAHDCHGIPCQWRWVRAVQLQLSCHNQLYTSREVPLSGIKLAHNYSSTHILSMYSCKTIRNLNTSHIYKYIVSIYIYLSIYMHIHSCTRVVYMFISRTTRCTQLNKCCPPHN